MMAASLSAQGMRTGAAWPWRGLGWALLAALLAHFSAWMLATDTFALSLQKSSDASSLSTRVIEPVPASLLPQVPSPVAEPSKAKVRAASATPSVISPAPASPPSNERLPDQPSNIEENQPLARTESTQYATETIANITTTTQASITDSVAPINGAPAPPGLKLSYPASAKLQFDGIFMSKGSAQNGSAVLNWKIDGSSYELSLEATALIIFSQVEKSEGQLSPQGLEPQRYSSVRTGRSEQATHFRAETGKIQFSNNKPEAVLLTGAQDRLSALIQLAGIIGGDPERYKIVNRIPMQVADLDKADVWEFNLQGVSDITLPAANMQALKLSRTPRNEFDQRLEIWLSPQLGYLPIRIRQSSVTSPDQDFTDLMLRKLP